MELHPIYAGLALFQSFPSEWAKGQMERRKNRGKIVWIFV